METVWGIVKELFYIPAIWIVVFIFLLRLIFQTKGKESNNILFWFALFLFFIWFIVTIKGAFFHLESKITGPYWHIFSIQMISPLIFYPLLFLKKGKLKTRWIFFALLSISFGYWYEVFAIITTSIHRDFIHSNTTTKSSFFNLFYYTGLLGKIFIGMVLGSIIFFIFEYRKKDCKQNEILDSLK
ncbi:MAG: hypothetical protein CMD20_02695 [Flavobacteriales bacterium]|nr:hypothetical protein [Flavobacteriales bacterium]